MQDTAKNLAFLSRRVSALEKKVQTLESTVAENTVLSERLSELVSAMSGELEIVRGYQLKCQTEYVPKITDNQAQMEGQIKYLSEFAAIVTARRDADAQASAQKHDLTQKMILSLVNQLNKQ